MLKLLGPVTTFRGQALFTLSENVRHTKGAFLRASPVCQNAPHPRNLSSECDLPPLPLPPLQVTLDKFLRTAKPLVSKSEFKHTEELVKKFVACGGPGEKLQNLLEKKAKTSKNWLADWWLRVAYLEFRSPVVVWSSPGLVFPFQSVKTLDDQITVAAKVIVSALDFYKIIIENKLPLEKMGKDPLDMTQYSKILGTCRIPGEKCDDLMYIDPCNPPKHVAVAFKDQFYEVRVFGNDGKSLNTEQVKKQLHEIVKCPPKCAPPIGILTSENRDTWAKAYQELIKDPQNKCGIKSIQQSLFLVCLDEPNPDLDVPNEKTIAALEMVHGCGSNSNGGNRWFDKTVQFIIGTCGELGLTYEHSPAEGPPIASLMDHVVKQLEQGGLCTEGASCVPRPRRLTFNVPCELQCVIETAAKNLDCLVNDLEMYGYVYKCYGKEFPKSQKMSPDSYIQMALQLAFYRLHDEPAAHYESASTRKFFGGRTETIRSCSIESVNFAKAMMDKCMTDQSKVQAMRDAVNAHKKYTLEAVNGFGVDRHFLGLKLAAIENNIEVPDLLKDVSHVRSSSFRISSSQVAGKSEAFMCFGPLVGDGYACCYNPRANDILMGISAMKSCPETNAADFRDAIEDSLNDMRDVLVKTQKSKM